MNYCALYRKYRPSTFDEVVGQEKIIKILSNSLENNHISHAYLFYGPKGTGKTSIAKLIAKMVNCEDLDKLNPCNKCESCVQFNNKSNPDIVEIDAASNNGVDEVREIRNKISFLPNVSKYRVYIIDEVHMLTPGAFNALLKTLEEPPEHVIFILATTEYFKVPSTIVSRCQCFEFSRIKEEDMIKKLEMIAKNEKISCNKKVFSLISNFSEGAMRDAIGLLEKLGLFANGNITEEDFYKFKGIIKEEELQNLVDKVMDGDVTFVIDFVNRVYEEGKDLFLLIEQLIQKIAYIIVDNSKNGIGSDKMYQIIDILYKANNDMKNSDNFKMFFEVSLIKCCDLCKIKQNIEQSKPMVDKVSADATKVDVVDQSVAEVQPEVVKETKLVTVSVPKESAEIIPAESNNDKKIKFINDRLNNAFALADKALLNEIKNNVFDATSYLHSKEFSSVVSFLIDGEIRVVGEKNVVISLKYDAMVDNANNDLSKLENLFSLIHKKFYKLIFISDDKWKELKKEYVANIKNGNLYEYKEETITSYPKKETNKKSVVDKAVDFFGEDMVEVE